MKPRDLAPLKDLQDSEVCRTCAECCKKYCYLTGWKAEVDRLALLATDRITIEAVNDALWKVTIRIPCRHLIQEGDAYRCACYLDRPAMCREYPFSLLQSGDPDLVRMTRQTCPLVPGERPGKTRGKKNPSQGNEP
jgi:hypothetical protein